MRRLLLATLSLTLACMVQPETKPSAEASARTLLAAYNAPDHQGLEALYGDRTHVLELHLQWFHGQVGPCSDLAPMKVIDPLHARFVFECERGELEILLRVDAETGAVKRTLLGARGVAPPDRVRERAEQLVRLAEGEPVLSPALAGTMTEAKLREGLDDISERGECVVDRVHLASARGARFVLECSTGSATMLVDLDRHGALRRFGVRDGAADHWRRRM